MEKIILIVLFGMAWGSFLNVVIYRLPLGLSIVHPPSSCPKCQKRIKAYDNLPLISYAILGGRCRHCRAPIPFTYFLVELITPLAFVTAYLHFSWTLHFLAACLFTSVLIALGFIDFFHQILPDEITLPGILLGLIYAAFRPDLTLRGALIGAVAGALFLLLIWGGYYLLRKKEGLGMGDVTMLLLIGAFLGLERTVLTLLLASFAGAFIGVFLILFRRKDMQFALPFGTLLAPAAYFSMLWGERIITWYLGLYKSL